MIRNLIFLILLLPLLSGCTPSYICYDAENWGNPVVTVNSNPQTTYKGVGNYQVANWSSTGYYLNGKDIYFVVQNSYDYACPGGEGHSSCQGGGQGSYYQGNPGVYAQNCSSGVPTPTTAFNHGWTFLYGNLPICDQAQILAAVGACEFSQGYSCSRTCKQPLSEEGKPNSNTSNNICASTQPCGAPYDNSLPVSAPCFLTYGIGAYLGISPGLTVGSDEDLVGNPVHLGAVDIGSSPFFNKGYQTGGVSMSPPSECTSGKCGVNFKILDKFYQDNNGAYNILLLSGVENVNPGIITSIVGFIQASLCWAREAIFQNLVSGSEFQSYVRALLLLYIVLYGIVFLMGFVQVTQKDLMIRVFKIAIIIQLLSPYSWEFFYDNFFQFFTQGIGEITGMLFGSGNDSVNIGSSVGSAPYSDNCPCNVQSLSGFEAFDRILQEVFSQATQAKLKAMIRWKVALGTVFYLIMNVIFILLVYIVIKSVLTYILSYLALSLLIILAPIFIPFFLFRFTKPLFDEWLKQLISYFIQPIVILTFTFFFFQLVTSQMYSLFGYTVCDTKWTNIKLGFGWDIPIYYWQAQTGPVGGAQEILIPNFHYQCGNSTGSCPCDNIFDSSCGYIACEPFQCQGERYPKYPYLDPTGDAARIKQLENGELIQVSDILMLVFMIWVMLKFNEIVPSIAKDIAGTPQQQTSMSQAATEMRSGMISTAKLGVSAAAEVGNVALKKATGGSVDVKKTYRKTIKKIKDSKVYKNVKEFTPKRLVGKYVYQRGVKRIASKAEHLTSFKGQVGVVYKGAKTLGKGAVDVGKVGLAGGKLAFGNRSGAAKTLGSTYTARGVRGIKSGLQDARRGASEAYTKADSGVKGVFDAAYEATKVGEYVSKGMEKESTSSPGRLKRGLNWVSDKVGTARDVVNAARDRTGGTIDTVYHAPKRALQQKLHDKTFGLLGKDYTEGGAREQEDSDYWAQVAEQHRNNLESFEGLGARRAAKAYDSYFRRATTGKIQGDTVSGAQTVGTRGEGTGGEGTGGEGRGDDNEGEGGSGSGGDGGTRGRTT